MSKKNNIHKIPLPIIIMFGMVRNILAAFSRGFVVSLLYSWFVLPVFIDAINISGMEFVGIVFMVRVIVLSGKSNDNDLDGDFTEYFEKLFTAVVIVPLILLMIGYFLKIIIY